PTGGRAAARPVRAAAPGAGTGASRAAPSLPRNDPTLARPPQRRRLAEAVALGLELLDDRLDGDDVPLELQLGLLEPGRDADQLRQMQDRHLEVLAGRLLQLRLPRVEREMAERARRHHRVGASLHGLLDRLDQLAERGLLARLDDREAAALDLGRVVDRLAAAGLDDRLERPGTVRILEPEHLRRPQDLAPVERCDLQALQSLVRDLLELLVPRAFRDQPEEVLDLDGARVPRHADRFEVAVDALAQPLVELQLPVRLPQVERADV